LRKKIKLNEILTHSQLDVQIQLLAVLKEF